MQNMKYIGSEVNNLKGNNLSPLSQVVFATLTLCLRNQACAVWENTWRISGTEEKKIGVLSQINNQDIWELCRWRDKWTVFMQGCRGNSEGYSRCHGYRMPETTANMDEPAQVEGRKPRRCTQVFYVCQWRKNSKKINVKLSVCVWPWEKRVRSTWWPATVTPVMRQKQKGINENTSN